MLRSACSQPNDVQKLQDLLNQLSSSGLVSQVSIICLARLTACMVPLQPLACDTEQLAI